MASVQLDRVSFSYTGRSVLESVSMTIGPGERVAVLGANGAGKTTLLKLIGGVLRPTHGFISISGTRLERLSPRNLARQIATVPQWFGVPFAFSVREVVELGRTPFLRPFGSFSATDRQAVEQAMELTGTNKFSDRIFNELSGGERQRVVIAMALAQQPRILLLDEPTQQLDLARQVEILDLIADLNQSRDLTVLAAIHDLNLATRYFGRLAFLHNGVITKEGAPSEVLSAELLQTVYGQYVEVFHTSDRSFPIILPLPKSEAHKRRNSDASCQTKER
jgi:iron complex transport system ATP-binding protein